MKENTIERITEACEALGNTSYDIAESLASLGITGGDSCVNCPIYNYLLFKFGSLIDAFDFDSESQWYNLVSPGHNDTLRVVKHFIFKYDNGHYPFLRSAG